MWCLRYVTRLRHFLRLDNVTQIPSETNFLLDSFVMGIARFLLVFRRFRCPFLFLPGNIPPQAGQVATKAPDIMLFFTLAIDSYDPFSMQTLFIYAYLTLSNSIQRHLSWRSGSEETDLNVTIIVLATASYTRIRLPARIRSMTGVFVHIV